MKLDAQQLRRVNSVIGGLFVFSAAIFALARNGFDLGAWVPGLWALHFVAMAAGLVVARNPPARTGRGPGLVAALGWPRMLVLQALCFYAGATFLSFAGGLGGSPEIVGDDFVLRYRGAVVRRLADRAAYDEAVRLTSLYDTTAFSALWSGFFGAGWIVLRQTIRQRTEKTDSRATESG